MKQEDKEILQSKIDNNTISSRDLLFGRKMPFGKYKDQYIYWLVVKHPYYMQWLKSNTNFQLTETETWLHNKCLEELHMANLNRWIYDLSKQVCKIGCLPENNPHYIVE